jgi:hypothetical protein
VVTKLFAIAPCCFLRGKCQNSQRGEDGDAAEPDGAAEQPAITKKPAMRAHALLLAAVAPAVTAQADPSKTYNFLAIGVRQQKGSVSISRANHNCAVRCACTSRSLKAHSCPVSVFL